MWKKAKNHNSVITAKPQPLQYPGISVHFKRHFDLDRSFFSIPSEVESPPDSIQLLQDSNLGILHLSPTHEEI